VRLRSTRDQGCSGFRACASGANKPDWSGKSTRARRRNWLSFYCDDANHPPSAVADCISSGRSVRFRCFTSRDSNWSLNAVMVHRRAMLEQVSGKPKRERPQVAIAIAPPVAAEPPWPLVLLMPRALACF